MEAWIAELVHAADHPRRAARARLFTAQQAVMRRFPDEVATATRLVVEPLEDANPREPATWACSPGPMWDVTLS